MIFDWLHWETLVNTAAIAVVGRIAWCGMDEVRKLDREHERLIKNQRQVMRKLGISSDWEQDRSLRPPHERR